MEELMLTPASLNGEHLVWLLLGLKRIQETLFLKHSKEKKLLQPSGTRIAVRFFAGYDLSSIDLNSDSLVSQAYDKGVTMGADLMHNEELSPDFLVWAQKDKNGAPLQRVQIIKGWVDSNSGMPHEKVYDVACSDGMSVDPITNRCPDNGARVNISDCSILSG
jgi:hypothetical protein